MLNRAIRVYKIELALFERQSFEKVSLSHRNALLVPDSLESLKISNPIGIIKRARKDKLIEPDDFCTKSFKRDRNDPNAAPEIEYFLASYEFSLIQESKRRRKAFFVNFVRFRKCAKCFVDLIYCPFI